MVNYAQNAILPNIAKKTEESVKDCFVLSFKRTDSSAIFCRFSADFIDQNGQKRRISQKPHVILSPIERRRLRLNIQIGFFDFDGGDDFQLAWLLNKAERKIIIITLVYYLHKLDVTSTFEFKCVNTFSWPFILLIGTETYQHNIFSIYAVYVLSPTCAFI